MNARSRAALTATASVALAVYVSAFFAFRSGQPGFTHDWMWPQTTGQFDDWFGSGMSTWLAHGFGSAQSSPTVNVVLLYLDALSRVGLGSLGVLAVFLTSCFLCAQYGMQALLRALDVRSGEFSTWALSAAYAFGPILFQKTVAGHIYYMAAFALMPWIARFTWNACRDVTGFRDALAAGLLLAVASAQIQFLFFGAAVVVLVALSSLRLRSAAIVISIVLGLGLVHNVALLHVGTGEIGGLVSRHATTRWEIDQSGDL